MGRWSGGRGQWTEARTIRQCVGRRRRWLSRLAGSHKGIQMGTGPTPDAIAHPRCLIVLSSLPRTLPDGTDYCSSVQHLQCTSRDRPLQSKVSVSSLISGRAVRTRCSMQPKRVNAATVQLLLYANDATTGSTATTKNNDRSNNRNKKHTTR